MSNKIYTSTFVRESNESITKLDDALSNVEQEINNLAFIRNKYTKGKRNDLNELSKTTVSNYDENIERMSVILGDLYSLKNDLLDAIEKIDE